MNTHPHLLIRLLLCLLLSTCAAPAATRTWTGGSVSSGNWTIPGNWDGGAFSPSNGDDLVFPAAAPRKDNTNNFAGFRAASITFSGAGGGYNLHGNALTVSNGIVALQSSGSNAVHLDLTLADSQTVHLPNATGTLGLHGNIALGAYTLTVNNRAVATLSGLISGSGGLVKSGTNWLYLDGSAANTYSGATTIHDGVLQANHPQSLGSTTGETRVYGDGGLRLDAGIATMAENLTLNGWGFGNLGVLRIPGDTVFSGSIHVLSNGYWSSIVNVAGGHTARFNGAITGEGSLQKHGAGTLVLAGATPNSPERGMSLSQGVLELRKTMPAMAVGEDITIPAGTVRAFDLSQIGADTDVTLYNDGVLDLSDLAVEDIGPLHNLGQPGGTLITPSTLLRINGHTNLGTQFSGDITGPGAVEFRDAYQLRLHGTNTYTGLTRLIHMRLEVNGILASRAVNVDAQSELTGRGQVNIVTNFGILHPGYFADPMTASNVVLQPGSILEARYAGPAPNLVVRGSLRLNNATLDVDAFANWTEGTSWILIDNDGVDAVIGQFLGLPEGAIYDGNGVRARITYFGGDGNDVMLTTTSTRVWDGGGADEYWTNPLNWVGNVAPLPGDSLRIPGEVDRRTTNDFPAGTSFHHLELGSGYQQVHGNLLRVTGGIEWVHDVFGGQGSYFHAPVEVAADQEFVLVSAMSGNFRGGLDLAGRTVTVRCTAAINNGLGMSGGLSGTGTLIVGTNAYVSLNATNAFSGSVRIEDEGNLTTSGRTLGGSAWQVAADGRLVLDNGIVPGAIVAPGGRLESDVSGPGTTNRIAGDLVLQQGSSFRLFTQPQSKLFVTGAVTVAGATLDLLPYDFSPQLGDTYVIVHNQGIDPVVGTFAGLAEGAEFHYEDAWYRITYAGGDGNDIALTLLLPPPTGMTAVWDGGAADSYWWNPTNWYGNTGPQAGDDVLFPVVASRKQNTNNIGFWGLGGYHSITFAGAFYDLRRDDYGSTEPLVLQNGLVSSNSAGTNIVGIPFDLVHTQSWHIASPLATLRFTAPTGEVQLSTNTVGSGALRKTGAGRLDVEGVTLAHDGTTLADGGTMRLLDGATVANELRLRSGTLDAVIGYSGPFVGEAGTLRLGGHRHDLTGEQPNGLLVSGDAILSSNVIFAPRLDGTNQYGPTLSGSAGVLAFVKGGLDLGGATLAVEVNCHPKLGDVFTIVLDLDEDGHHITNTFAGLPEGAVYQTGPWRFQIGYQAMNERAVQLTALIRAPEFTSVGMKDVGTLLEGMAEKSRPVRIEATTDFVNWTTLGEVSADANGAFNFTDTQEAMFPNRFYRAIGL